MMLHLLEGDLPKTPTRKIERRAVVEEFLHLQKKATVETAVASTAAPDRGPGYFRPQPPTEICFIAVM